MGALPRFTEEEAEVPSCGEQAPGITQWQTAVSVGLPLLVGSLGTPVAVDSVMPERSRRALRIDYGMNEWTDE